MPKDYPLNPAYLLHPDHQIVIGGTLHVGQPAGFAPYYRARGAMHWDKIVEAMRYHYIVERMLADRKALAQIHQHAYTHYFVASERLASARRAAPKGSPYAALTMHIERKAVAEHTVKVALDNLWEAQQGLQEWDNFWSAKSMGNDA